MTDTEFKEKLVLMTAFDDPAYYNMNDKHTLMVTSDGDVRLLVFSKDLKEEVFIPCTVSIEQQQIIKGNKNNIIMAKSLPSFQESKRLHKGLGMQMSSI